MDNEAEIQALKTALVASEVYRKISDRHFTEIVNENAELKAESESLRAALNRIITAYNENEPDLVHYDDLYEVVRQVKKGLK